jgi:hypothetical protein
MPPQGSWPSNRATVESSRERNSRHVTVIDAVVGLVIVLAIVAMAIWFIFFSSGGIGPGSV